MILWAQADSTESLVEQLRSDKPELREDAGRRLRSLGAAAIGPLEKARKAGDPDFAGRAAEVLGAIRSDLAPAERERLRSRLQAAKTLRIHFEAVWESTDRDPRSRKELAGSWVLGEGGKARGRLRVKTSLDDSSSSYAVFLSDGSRWLCGTFDPEKAMTTPPDLRARLIDGLLDLGPAYASFLLVKHPPEPKESFNPFGHLDTRRDFRWREGKESGTKELTYRMGEAAGVPELENCLTYSQETSAPVARVLTIAEDVGRPRSVLTESYKKFVLDEDVSGDGFALPEHTK